MFMDVTYQGTACDCRVMECALIANLVQIAICRSSF